MRFGAKPLDVPKRRLNRKHLRMLDQFRNAPSRGVAKQKNLRRLFKIIKFSFYIHEASFQSLESIHWDPLGSTRIQWKVSENFRRGSVLLKFLLRKFCSYHFPLLYLKKLRKSAKLGASPDSWWIRTKRVYGSSMARLRLPLEIERWIRKQKVFS